VRIGFHFQRRAHRYLVQADQKPFLLLIKR
jgi:hypothetical protein